MPPASTWLIIATILLSFQQSVRSLERKPKPDACPHVEKSPTSNVSLRFMKINNNEERLCCGCNRGFYVSQLCSTNNKTDTGCTKCKQGTYIDKYAHKEQTCQVDDLVCPENMIKIPSQPDHAPRCDCLPGYHRTSEGQCKPHSLCPPGEGVESRGNPFHDTVCKKCKHGYESPRESAEDRCELMKSLMSTSLQPTFFSFEETATSSPDLPISTTFCINKTTVVVSAVGIVIGSFLLGCVVTYLVNKYRLLQKTCFFQNNHESPREENREMQTISHIPSFVESGLGTRNTSGNSLPSNQSNPQVITINVSEPPSADAQVCDEEPSPSSALLPSNDANNQQQVSSYESTMNEIKLELMELMDDDQTYKLFRTLTKHLDIRQEIFISNLKKEGTSGEKVCKVFDKLQSLLGKDKFNAKALYQYFAEETDRLIVDKLRKYLKPQEMWLV